MADLLDIKQGATRTVTVKGLRDAEDQVLDPTGWSIHAVARPGLWAAPIGVWRDQPTGDELQAEVVDADPTETGVLPGEKWIDLHIDAAVSDTWHWSVANLDVEITEPGTGRQETFTTQLRLVATTVRDG